MHGITIKSNRPLVVIPVDEYESMKETLELLAANPNLLEELEQERRNVAKGDCVTWAEFRKKYEIETNLSRVVVSKVEHRKEAYR